MRGREYVRGRGYVRRGRWEYEREEDGCVRGSRRLCEGGGWVCEREEEIV